MGKLSTLQIESLKRVYDSIIDFLDDFDKTDGFTGALWYEFERKGSKYPEEDIPHAIQLYTILSSPFLMCYLVSFHPIPSIVLSVHFSSFPSIPTHGVPQAIKLYAIKHTKKKEGVCLPYSKLAVSMMVCQS